MNLEQVIRVLFFLVSTTILYTNYVKAKDPDRKIFGLDFKNSTRVILAIIDIILIVLILVL